MKTLWDKGGEVDAEVAAFTVGDDRVVDGQIARHDVLGSLAHVATLADAGLMDADDATAIRRELLALLADAELAVGPEDEDIHSTVERILTQRLGEPAKRIHTARSRNDQVATDIALWMREQVLAAHSEALTAVKAALAFAEAHQGKPVPGMTHLQPAMPSTWALWALGFAGLLLDDAQLLQTAWQANDACPLGSAAGYGLPASLAPLDRDKTAAALGFARPVEPVTAVQGGRGKNEATVLFAMAQATTTCSRLASDVVLFVNPSFGWLTLPDRFTTGSSIMPQKKNPDVMELVRGHAHSVRAALIEVLGLAGGLPGGYHRDFQLLKAPLLRGVARARSVLRIVGRVLSGLEIVEERAAGDCHGELFATHRALSLVASGVPFRDAYRQVAAEVASGQVPETCGELPSATAALSRVAIRLRAQQDWNTTTSSALSQALATLASPETHHG